MNICCLWFKEYSSIFFVLSLCNILADMKGILILIFFLLISFLAQSQLTSVQFNNMDSATGWIPFEFYNNQIYLSVTINGHHATAMLADGITSRIDRDFANSIGLLPQADGHQLDEMPLEIQIANLRLRDIRAPIMPPRHTGHPRDLILGDELFNELAVDIDFARRRMSLCYPAGITPPVGAVDLPLSRTGDSRSVPVAVEGETPMLFQVYLGDPAPLTIYHLYSETHGLLQGRPVSVRLGAGGGKYPREAVATVSRISFAGVVFSRVPGTFPADSVSGPQPAGVVGHIGMGTLARYHLIFDYPHNLLFAAPYAGVAQEQFPKDNSGLFLIEKQGSYIVEFASPHSPASQSGFKAGDTVMEINHQPVSAFQGQAWQTPGMGSLRFTDPGTTYTFLLKDGSIRKLETAAFF